MSEKDVTAVTLSVELERAVIAHVLQDDQRIYVTEDGWFPFWIRVQDSAGYVTFRTYTNFKKSPRVAAGPYCARIAAQGRPSLFTGFTTE